MRVRFTVAIAALSIAFLCSSPRKAFAQCAVNGECLAAQYCQKAAGDCNGTGDCADVPLVCPQNYDPVCGCDGTTYSNSCVAAQASVNVASAGVCLCQDSSDCDSGDFCLKDEGSCAGSGVCTLDPDACPLVYEPVCGCDNLDYNNACFAYQAGTTVAYTGGCQPTCLGNDDCVLSEYCDTAHNGCGGVGICRIRPALCTEIYDPVCGCNEFTPDNACFAAQMGITVASAGACGPCPFDSSTDCIFTDSAESGGTTRWSSVVGN